ncbi:XRE family transcriptional regulator [Herbiconiux sp. CPCC 205763]|uniref:XRE family transcriptional regulator n=1 Tax=Herbiconiux aconitum TaxID=2970913 RepID=A0ABT2GW85_9MICO|nr:XRE family transcriptional regulator [Herbiconiux aconitum]MCS5719837.1 XRE family transcriptional regulator [Herbiconiux aconitum]
MVVKSGGAGAGRSTGPLDEEAVAMGGRIRSLRRERALTLVQLAGLVGMSQPFLSLVERGHARLSLASMARLSAALGVPSGALLATPPSERLTGGGVDVVHAKERPAAGHRAVWQLAQLPRGLFGIEMVGVEREYTEFATHEEDEFLYLLGGTLQVGLLDGTGHTLRPGDSLAIEAGVAHGWRAIGPRGFRVVIVTSGVPSH